MACHICKISEIVILTSTNRHSAKLPKSSNLKGQNLLLSVKNHLNDFDFFLRLELSI